MGLEISQTFAKIGIETSPSSLEINTQAARLELHQKHASIKIHTESPRIEIDQYECFASSGLKGNYDRAKEIAERAYQQVLEFIGKTAEDGYTLAAIENKGNPLAQIAERDAWPQHEFGIVSMPSVGPRITVKEGTIEIDPGTTGEGSFNGVEGMYTPPQTSIGYTPAKVNIYMQQYNSISLKFIDSRIDEKI